MQGESPPIRHGTPMQDHPCLRNGGSGMIAKDGLGFEHLPGYIYAALLRPCEMYENYPFTITVHDEVSLLARRIH